MARRPADSTTSGQVARDPLQALVGEEAGGQHRVERDHRFGELGSQQSEVERGSEERGDRDALDPLLMAGPAALAILDVPGGASPLPRREQDRHRQRSHRVIVESVQQVDSVHVRRCPARDQGTVDLTGQRVENALSRRAGRARAPVPAVAPYG